MNSTQRLVTLTAMTALLAACGGGGGENSPPIGVQANGAIVTGVASKGPLNGSTVCAFAIVNGTQGAALGSCATGIVNGDYSINIGTYAGPVLLEATGGSYRDEATGFTVPLTSPLRSIIGNVTGSGVSVAITPLTELAFQDANSITAGLTSARVQAAIARVQTSFGVSDIVNTQPVDPLNVPASVAVERKTYALALATLSQFHRGQATGTSLGEALQTIRICLADSSRCGTGATSVGRYLTDAMNRFQANNVALAGTTLNVATIGAIPSPACVSPQVVQNGACVTPASVCSAPQVLQGGVCVTPVPVCPSPQVLQGGACVTPAPVCTAPQVLQGGVCVTPVPVCTSPQVLQGGACVTPAPVCSAPQVLQGGVCVTPVPVCPSPQVLQGGACVTPNSSIYAERPDIRWEDRPIPAISPPGYTYDLRLCGPDCQDITTVTIRNPFYSGTVSQIQIAGFRRTWNGNAEVTQAVKNQVSRELQAMLNSLWLQIARPDKETLIAAIKRGFQDAKTPSEVTARAASSLAFQGYPTGYAASGTGTGTTGGTGGTGSAGECTTKAYTGPTTDAQVYIYDYIAQIDQCLYRATGNVNYITDGDRQCFILSGLIAATNSQFRPQYCAGTKLIR